ncbi:PUTATIVE SIGNAL-TRANSDUCTION SENSOR PROTEIN [hydrothermal vent metagenome]|uniref:PUTATIVE SIGNAL-TRANSDUCTION SENSOR PROTEIN n=1 Tax=hydrothermal vent metagenome TaxID=652676 RepID=A0A3B1DGI4_9ZZZZ
MSLEKNQKLKALNQEIEFKIEELFFSTTDSTGNILSGNDVFVKISQYSREELIGAPHNIIRHPDMPKLVFKVLWDSIQAGKPIGAYVKNLAKDGRYYWVLATVFPIPDGYLSIRLKPTTPIFNLMPDVYAALIEAEQKGGVEDSLKVLLGILQSKGFKSYDAFFLTALTEELKARDKIVQKSQERDLKIKTDFSGKKNEALFHIFTEVQRKCVDLKGLFNKLFSNVHLFLELRDNLGDSSALIIDLSQQIFHLAMNANVESFRAGNDGASLAVLAKEIQVRSDEMKHSADIILKQANILSEDSDRRILEIGVQMTVPKLQNEMIDSFICEMLLQKQSEPFSQKKVKQMQENGMVLINLLEVYSKKTIELLMPLRINIKELIVCVETIETIFRALEMTQISGAIESARIGEKGKTFLVVFNEMDRLNKGAQIHLEKFRELLKNILEHVDDIFSSENQIKEFLQAIKLPIEGMLQITPSYEKEQSLVSAENI